MQTKTVFISGASRGIGRAIAIEFGRHGYQVIINCHKSESDLLVTQSLVEATDAKCYPILGDVSDYERVEKMLLEIQQHFPNIDVLVNNAGVAHYSLFTDTSPSEWQRLFQINLFSAYNLCHLIVPHMIRQHAGNIINISSIWGTQGASCEVAYSATKAGLNGFTKALAKELAPSNIRVNALICGAVDTQMNAHLESDELEAFTAEIPMGRFGTPEEIAQFALFIASDNASYITGQLLPIDGGLF